jgi:thiol:disulfide interchange protein
MIRPTAIALAALACAACGSEESARASVAEPGAQAEAPPPEIERPYDEGADAQAEIDAAIAATRDDGKRVLLVFGANWCVWCRRLDWVFQHDEQVSAAIRERWHVVHVDVGARGTDSTNHDVVMRYGNPRQHGLPCLVVLDEQGGVAFTQETGALESGDRHDPARVLAFLNGHHPS